MAAISAVMSPCDATRSGAASTKLEATHPSPHNDRFLKTDNVGALHLVAGQPSLGPVILTMRPRANSLSLTPRDYVYALRSRRYRNCSARFSSGSQPSSVAFRTVHRWPSHDSRDCCARGAERQVTQSQHG